MKTQLDSTNIEALEYFTNEETGKGVFQKVSVQVFKMERKYIQYQRGMDLQLPH